MSSPLISIVVASKGEIDFLRQTIDNVITQGDSSVELIVIDGGSNDGTDRLLASYGSCVRAWLSEPDRGIYDAWNKGLALSRGRWIAFLGAGDIFCQDALKIYKEFVINTDCLEFVSSKVKVHRPGTFSRIIGQPWDWSIFRHYMNIAHVGSFHNRELFNRYGQFNSNLKICGDYEFLLRSRSALKSGFIDDVTVEMMSGGISDSSTRVIWETLLVKLEMKVVGKPSAILDYIEALTKWYLRRGWLWISQFNFQKPI